MLRKSILAFLILGCPALLGSRQVLAQVESQAPTGDRPKPAGSSANPIPLINERDVEQESGNSVTPDTTPLTGVQDPTLGSPEVLHSYFVPGIQWSGSLQSRPYNQTVNSNWVMNNYVIGNLSMLKAWSRSQLSINYSGGGFFSNDSSQSNGNYQQLAFAQSFQWNRWSLQALDQFSYLPQSSFGFGGGTNLGIPGTGGSLGPVIPGMGNSYVPNQSIFAATGSRYSNAASLQLTYATSARGSITMSGSYGLLNFVESGNVDNDMITGTLGYNYTLTANDTIGVFYRFSAYHFSGQPEAYGDHSANIAYSKKITGRLVLQLYGGPDFTVSRTSTNGDNLTYGVNCGATVRYGVQDGELHATYSHGISGGSGVLTGSSGDLLSFGADHKLGRIWTSQVNMGYAHNSPVQNSPLNISQSFNTWNAGGGVNRMFGRNTTFGIAYNATITDYPTSSCSGSACNSSQTYQYVTISFSWQTRPIVLP